jgi:ABC-type sugar transport system substrate-binding protein
MRLSELVAAAEELRARGFDPEILVEAEDGSPVRVRAIDPGYMYDGAASPTAYTFLMLVPAP